MTKQTEALTLALEALETIYTVGDVTCVVKPEGEIYLKPVIDKCKAALTQPDECNFCPRCGKRLASGFVEISIHNTCTPLKENT